MIIIGAGAAGLAAAVTLGRAGWRVTLLEQNSKIGKKILASGNGKCNISNKNIHSRHFHSQNHQFLEEVLEGFSFHIIEEFFNSIGLELIEGKEGKIFPMSLQASSVVEILEYEAEQAGVEIVCDCTVTGIDREGDLFRVESSQGTQNSSHLLIAWGVKCRICFCNKDGA